MVLTRQTDSAYRGAKSEEPAVSFAISGASATKVPLIRWSPKLVDQLAKGCDGILMLVTALFVPRLTGSEAFPTAFHHWSAAAGLAILTIYLLDRVEAYQLSHYRRISRTLLDAAGGLTVSGFILLLTTWIFFGPNQADTIWVLGWAFGSFLLIAVERQLLKTLINHGLQRGIIQRQVAIIGATPQAESLITSLLRPDLEQPCKIIGIYDDRESTRRPSAIADVEVLGTIDALCHYAADNPVDLIVITLPWQRAMQISGAIDRLQWISADVMVLLDEQTFNPRTTSAVTLAGVPALPVMRQPLGGVQSISKILEDYIVASVALVILSPVMLIAAIAIQLNDPGPILFRQLRIGFNNRPFKIYKFRTMVQDPRDRGVVGVDKDDPRITPVGRILRRLSIDEIPQLFNVLRGEMSIVGPRPHVPGMLVGDTEYTGAVREYAARHRIKPGITGWAQIHGMRGGIHNVDKARRGVDLDMFYIENCSIWLDARIIVRTIIFGMFGRDVF